MCQLNLKLSPKGVPQIKVTFKLGSDGILEVEAMDTISKSKINTKIVGKSGLTDDEIKKIKEDAQINEEIDNNKVEIVLVCDRLTAWY